MVEFLQALLGAREQLAIGITVLVAVMASLQVFLTYRAAIVREVDRYAERAQQHIQSESVDDLSRLLVQNFRVLNSFYSENLSQSRTSTLASISIAVLGFIVILAGILIAFLGEQAILGTVSSAAGIVSEAAAVLFFRQNRVFQAQMEGSLKKLVSTQYLMTSVALAREMPQDAKVEEIREINKHLRELMNALHAEYTEKS